LKSICDVVDPQMAAPALAKRFYRGKIVIRGQADHHGSQATSPPMERHVAPGNTLDERAEQNASENRPMS